MSNNRSEEMLMALLSAKPDGFAGRSGGTAQRGSASLPRLDERIDMFARAVFGPDVLVTPKIRALARDKILTAMAADLAGTAERNALETEQDAYAASAVPVAARRAHRTSGWQSLIANLAASLTVPRLAMAAVPLMLLIVAGSVLTQNWGGGDLAEPQQPQATPSAPKLSLPGLPNMRGFGSPSVDTPAEKILRQTIAEEEAAHGRSTVALASKLVDLATLYRVDHRYREAQALCERALIIADAVLGPTDPETLRIINELATIYRAEGRTKEANDILNRANQP